ncbi:MAG: hypothetical protein ACREPP_12430 [Rhodanobacteraceae bacterium]
MPGQTLADTLKVSISHRPPTGSGEFNQSNGGIMRSTSALLVAGLTAATVTTAWAGMTGNGSQSNSTSFAFCYGGNPYTQYFSRVFPLASSATNDVANKGVDYTHYLTGTGYRTNGGQCITAPSMAAAVAEKQKREEAEEYHHRKVVETEWAGS